MGRGGGGGGGHRSSGGGGGSRSFGGSSRGSSSHRGGFSSSSSSRSSFSPSRSGYRPPPPPRVYGGGIRVNNYYGGTRYSGGAYRRPVSSILSMIVTAVVVLVVICMLFGALSSVGSSSVTRSTVTRTKLEPYASFQKNAWDDHAGWLSNAATLNKGMESFYKATGVQPALGIMNDIEGNNNPSNAEVEAFASDLYDTLIGHERGILLLFCEWYPSDYDVYYMAGEDAQTVMDSEACDILMDYVHAYYTSDLTEDEYFAKVFADTGERIMTVTPTLASRLPMILCVIGIGIAGIVVIKLVAMKHKRERERAEETERILNTPNERL